MKNQRILCRWLGLIFLLTGAAPMVATSDALTVSLHFAPQESTNSDAPRMDRAATAKALRIGGVVDARAIPDKAVIGENAEKQGRHIEIRSRFPVSDFVTASLEKCLTSWGVRLDNNAELVLKAEIANLWVKEENRYNGDVNIRFRLEDATGKSLWEGVAVGHASTWGRSLWVDNYNQVLSDAMRLLSANLLDSTGFVDAWAGEASAKSASTITGLELKKKVLVLIGERVGTDVIVGYVRSVHLAASLTADEILDWKRSGIAEEIIKAALERSARD